MEGALEVDEEPETDQTLEEPAEGEAKVEPL